MKEAKEPEIIKLFGKKIILPENGRVRSPVISTVQESVKKISIPNNGILFPAGVLRDQAVFNKENNYVSERDHRIEEKIASEKFEEDDGKEFEEADEAYEQKQVTEKDKYSTGEESENPNDNSNITLSNDDSTTGEPSKNQKTLKKPDKILPCPRCKSMDTKFCYYNNYNVLQPRHFCKSCQRYWTAGGTMRNVPVGAGRRKNKAATVPHFGHITISDTPPLSQIETSNNYHHQAFKPKRTFLSFGSDSPLHESTRSVLNLVERTPSLQNMNAFPSSIPCLPGVPWPYNAISMPFYPPPYWNRSVPGPWNVPWVSPNSSTLGKHSRNGELLKPNTREGDSALEKKESEGSVIVPKTLRIDDPDEAAKSSIWETLGIKFDNCVNNGGIFNGYKSKADEKKHISTLSPVLHANPAALSRALSYQETA